MDQYEEYYDEDRGVTILVDSDGNEVEGYCYSWYNSEWVECVDD